MTNVRVETDLFVCQKLWESLIPQEYLTDLWQVREIFRKSYNRSPFFITAYADSEPVGLLPLSWIPEENCYGYYPGEVWKSTTWLEQNRIIADSQVTFEEMIKFLEKEKCKYHLRYLVEHSEFYNITSVDEIGYLFAPAQHNHSMEEYYSSFSSRRSIKTIKKEVARFYERGLDLRLDHVEDFELIVKMNIERFGDASYFADERFTASFYELKDFLLNKGWLKLITMLVDGKVAAVDIGSVYNNHYTLLAGGTNAEFPGIAKAINLYHMQKSCEEKYEEADFLCGDFFWKPMFQLKARPLYLLSNSGEKYVKH